MQERAADRIQSSGVCLIPGKPMGYIRKFAALGGDYWRGTDKWKARWLTLCLIALTIAQVVVPVASNFWSKRLFDALEQKSMAKFLAMIGVLCIIIAANMVIVTVHLRVKRGLQLGWRNWLTHKVMHDWMAEGRHYQITHMTGEHDNPDGRIAEDIRIGTEVAIELAHSLFYCALLLISFTQILWTLSGSPYIYIFDIELYLPGHLVWVALLYAALGTSVATLLGRPLVRAVNIRQTCEANFRFGLVHARENSEAIALLHGEDDERRRFMGLFRGLGKAWDRQTGALSRISLFTSGYSILSTAFPVLIAAPRYITGSITLGVLMQTSQAFQQMAGSLSWPIDNLGRVAEWRASVERVLSLHQSVACLQAHTCRVGEQTIDVEPADRPTLALVDLAIHNPDGSVIVRGLNAEFLAGERVLIAGDPGTAVKLFKVVAGLWPWGEGRVELPNDATIFFMPQRPYLPLGPLRSALSYPAAPDVFDSAQLRAVLARVGLDHLTTRLGETGHWEQELATAEQQRLGFARLLLHRPNWIFIQEATDALDPAAEEDMMRMVNDQFSAATVLTVGYHSTLDAYHHRKLVLVRTADGLALIEERRAEQEVEYNAPE